MGPHDELVLLSFIQLESNSLRLWSVVPSCAVDVKSCNKVRSWTEVVMDKTSFWAGTRSLPEPEEVEVGAQETWLSRAQKGFRKIWVGGCFFSY